jgi:hypothetical protein
MLNLDDYKMIFAISGLIALLLIASPTLSLILDLPSVERFSELWILGPKRIAENYVTNITADQSYPMYVGVRNHLASSAYYTIYVKFRNQTEPLPNATTGTPSSLQPLFKYHVFLQDGKDWEAPIEFSFSDIIVSENQSVVGNLMINNVNFRIDKQTSYDAEKKGYYYQLFIELWLYNIDEDQLVFHNRFVGFWLNMTGVI